MRLLSISLISLLSLVFGRLDFLHSEVCLHLGLEDQYPCDPSLSHNSVAHHVFTEDNIHELDE